MVEYEYEIQTNYGDGWELSTTESTRKEAGARLKEYRENQPEYAHRIKRVKEAP